MKLRINLQVVVYKNITNFCFLPRAFCFTLGALPVLKMYIGECTITDHLKRKVHPESYLVGEKEKKIIIILCAGKNWKVVQHYTTLTF